jgi:quinolinate synthase
MMEKIVRLKRARNAVILVHNYQIPPIQEIADFIGDSLGLSIQASKTDADIIIFCGVDFMAESAKILNPDKKVIHPSKAAKCPMAAMVDISDLRELKKIHPNAASVAYVNTTADTKAEVDICCTSANAVNVVKQLSEEEIIFIPDVNLGLYVQRFASEKKFIFWQGYCHVHQDIAKDTILKLKSAYPKSEILVHPECIPEVIDCADFVYSTEGMVKHCAKSNASEFIIGTEKELCYRLKKENPAKTFHPIKSAVCPSMKKITLKKVLESLENLKPEVKLEPDIMVRARNPLELMMQVGRGG